MIISRNMSQQLSVQNGWKYSSVHIHMMFALISHSDSTHKATGENPKNRSFFLNCWGGGTFFSELYKRKDGVLSFKLLTV